MDQIQYAKTLRDDFAFFLHELWRDRGFDKVAPLSEIELDMAHHLISGAKAGYLYGPKKRGVVAARGIGKTHIVAALCAYRYYRDPDRKIVYITNKKPFARDTLMLVRKWLSTVEFLRHLAPTIRQNKEKDSEYAFDISGSMPGRQASMSCSGIKGGTESNRAHTFILDDVETKTNTRTVEAQAFLIRLVSEGMNILYPDSPLQEILRQLPLEQTIGNALQTIDKKNPLTEPFSQIPPQTTIRDAIQIMDEKFPEYIQAGAVDPVEVIVLGTLKVRDSIYVKLADKGYEFRTYPVAYPSVDMDFINLAPIITRNYMIGGCNAGDPTLPHRFSRKNIEEKQLEGPDEWALEHMCQINYGTKRIYPLRLEDFITVPAIDRDRAPYFLSWGKMNDSGKSTRIEEQTLGFNGDALYGPAEMRMDQVRPYLGTKVWIDPAGRGFDETAYGAAASLNGFLWIKDIQTMPGGASRDDMRKMCEFARLHNANEIYIESNADTFELYQDIFQSILYESFLKPGENPLYPQGWKCSLVRDNKKTRSSGQKEVRIIAAIEPMLAAHRIVIAQKTISRKGGQPENELQTQITRITKRKNSLKQDGQIDVLAGLVQIWDYTAKITPKTPEQNTQKHFNDLTQGLNRILQNRKNHGFQPKSSFSPQDFT